MANWFHKFLNPHCPHCEREAINEMICPSCDVLTEEVARLRLENERLLDKLLKEPESERTTPVDSSTLLKPRGPVPWKVRQQILEEEDRAKARAMRSAAQSDTTVEKLEQELDVVSKQREVTSGA